MFQLVQQHVLSAWKLHLKNVSVDLPAHPPTNQPTATGKQLKFNARNLLLLVTTMTGSRGSLNEIKRAAIHAQQQISFVNTLHRSVTINDDIKQVGIQAASLAFQFGGSASTAMLAAGAASGAATLDPFIQTSIGATSFDAGL